MRILVAEDEKDLAFLMQFELQKAGHSVVIANDGIKALENLSQDPFDLVLCDIMMPGLDGLNLLRRVRETSDVPWVFITSRGEEMDKVLGFGLGADDYLVKPFAISELIARIEAIYRRTHRETEAAQRIRIGGIVLDTIACTVTVDGTLIQMNTKEYLLLKHFMEHPGRVFTKAQLYEAIWHQDSYMDDNTVMVHISHLRKLIDDNKQDIAYIQTIHGLGYRFRKDNS